MQKVKYAIGAGLGAGIGYLFWKRVGCPEESCPFKASPGTLMTCGGLVGLLIARIL